MSKGKLLLVDDDLDFCAVLKTALEKRQFVVTLAHDVEAATQIAANQIFDYATIDLKMPGPSGLQLIRVLLQHNPLTNIVILTGYASINTAIEAIKLGASHYLAKPVNADDVVEAFQKQEGNASAPLPKAPTPVHQVEWEHIQQVLKETEFNISEAARKLGIHRRTLQRKLQKKHYR